MSILKTTLAAASLALVAATAANAQSYVPLSKRQAANIEARQARAQQDFVRGNFVRRLQQNQTNEWELGSPQPFSREANENFTW